MSYEGYTEYKCRHGHTGAADVYMKQPIICYECGEHWVKVRSIDQTNGHDVGPWRDVEFRPRFKDYVKKGYQSVSYDKQE